MVSEVRLAVPPGHGQLRMWGRRGADWFALVEWLAQTHDFRLHGGAHRGAIFCTGWVPSEHVARLDGQDYAAVPRIELHPDPQHWPTRLRAGVASTNTDYYFGLLDGGPIAPPAGVLWLKGHGSLYE
ncbi:MAG TPA: hypothetical protein VHD81_03600 [Mycobacteriales bacterium]|nr:hypothetical protein [Mycobacteriales bacterium]